MDRKQGHRDKIEKYIKDNDYTWTVDSLLVEFEKFINGSYISYTAELCIKNCLEDFEYLFVN